MPGKPKDDIPEQEFKLIENREDSIIYEHSDGTVVFAEQVQGGWDVGAVVTGQSGVTELAQTDNVDDAIDAMTAFMADYESPTDGGDMGGGDMNGDGGSGILAGLGDAAAGIASTIDSAGSDRDRSTSPLFASGGGGGEMSPLFEMDDDDGPSAFERLASGDSGGGSSGLFEQTASDDGPSVFEEFGDMDGDRGPSAFERLDSGGSGGGSSGLFEEMGGDRDGPSAFEKLDDSGDGGGLVDRLDDEDSTLNDVYK